MREESTVMNAKKSPPILKISLPPSKFWTRRNWLHMKILWSILNITDVGCVILKVIIFFLFQESIFFCPCFFLFNPLKCGGGKENYLDDFWRSPSFSIYRWEIPLLLLSLLKYRHCHKIKLNGYSYHIRRAFIQ